MKNSRLTTTSLIVHYEQNKAYPKEAHSKS